VVSELAVIEPTPFQALGRDLRFGVTDDGVPFVVGADFARALDYRDTANAARVLDPDEKGTQIVSTPGGPQQMVVFYEDGIWELIFRSSKPEAKALKKRVKEILSEIRRTGSYSQPTVPDLATPAGVLAMAEQFAATARQLVAAEAKVAELAPKAAAVDALTEVGGALKMGAVANMFGIGRNSLFRILYAEQVLQRDRRPYQQYADWFRVVMTTHESAGREVSDYTSYLWPHGAARLHSLLSRRGYNLNPLPEQGALAVVPSTAS
jgi:prophage antirepressor-like protein